MLDQTIFSSVTIFCVKKEKHDENMKCIPVKVFLLIAIFSIYMTFSVDGQSINATEIISIKNKTFNLNLMELESILGSDDIKDRQVVVVSIVGPYRSGKSFLLNFFLKYLYAQVENFII